MRQLYLTIVIVLLASCSYNSNKEQVAGSALDASEVKNGSEVNVENAINDSMLYINKVGYFPETNELYVPLTFKLPTDESYFNSLADKADSAISSNDDMGRFRLPMSVAKEAFDFSNIKVLDIYDSQDQFVGRAKLKRAEYVVDMNAYFVAVLKLDKAIPANAHDYYCLGTAKVDLKQIKTQTIEDNSLTERIKKELNLIPEYIWRVQHVNVQPYNSVFSLLAFSQENGETFSYLTEYKNDEIQLLYKLKEEYTLDDLTPVPVEINEKPVLLLHLTLPESDAIDDYVVAYFEGNSYKITENNRIKIK